MAAPIPARLGSSSSSPVARSRAGTMQNRTGSHDAKTDIFEKSSLISGEEGIVKDVNEIDSPTDIPEGFDELPIELISLTDRFIESLGAKVYNTPPSVDKLSTIFQDFYTKAESHIATHINALSVGQLHRVYPSTSIPSNLSHPRQPSRSSSKDTLSSLNGSGPEQQMLTPQEISNRRKARRLLERKKLALEEAVERRVCERVYNRIWRHRSTLDEVRDEKLRSRTAALALVGIGLRDLGIDLNSSRTRLGGESDIEIWIAKARDGLLRMNDAKYPLGKLQQIAAAHKNIVDLLTALHQGSSSADEILPTLIYTLITTPPEGINVISNLHFIQRFRALSKVDGEAAYCLTNLEAAITFLETVDLASLRSDESLEGPSPSKSATSRPATPQGVPATARSSRASTLDITSSPSPLAAAKDKSTPATHPLRSSSPADTSPLRPSSHQRRISNLFQPPANAIGAAGDAVRNTADQGIKSIGSALDNSFKLLFGRLGEQELAAVSNDAASSIIVPKTLDDARKLIEPQSAEDDEVRSSTTSISEKQEDLVSSSLKSDDGLLSAIAGRKQPRDRSVDSSGNSQHGQQELPNTSNAAVESMRNLGNSLNPLRSFGGMNVMRGFGRTQSSGTPTPPLAAVVNTENPSEALERSNSPSKAAVAGMKTLPPIRRFITMTDAQELKLGDIPDLLQDYKRLAEALRTMGAF